MAGMSQVAIMYAFKDAKADILELHARVLELQQELDDEPNPARKS
jgi:hypothetical protein